MQQRVQSTGRGRAYLWLAVSLVAAGLVAFLVFGLIEQVNKQAAEVAKARETYDVVVARRDLNVGVQIAEDDIVVRAVDANMVPAEVVFSAPGEVVGQTPKDRILANEMIRAERLARADAGIGLNAIIDRGMRAMAIFVNSEQAVAGFVQPGNYVDVLVTIKPDDPQQSEAKAYTKVIMQKIKVLAVGTTLNMSPTNKEESATPNSDRSRGNVKPTVTLMVDLEQAEQLAHGSSLGDIHLALRADVDIDETQTEGATAAELIGQAPTGRSVSSARATPRTLTTVAKQREEDDDRTKAVLISGSKEKDVYFDETGSAEETVEKKSGVNRGSKR